MNKQKLKGIRYILFAAFFFASMNLFVKMAGDLPVWQKCFFRNLVAGFIAIGMLIKKRERIQSLSLFVIFSVLSCRHRRLH